MSKSAPRKTDPGWTPYLLAFVAVAALMNVLIVFAKRTPTITDQLTNAPAPASAELTVQNTPDNYGVALFLTLRDADGKEMSGVGHANVTAFEGPTAEGEPMWSGDYRLMPASFTKGTRGQGPFQQDAYFARLGSVTTQQLFSKTGQYMTFRVIFTPDKGSQVIAKESHSLP